MFRFGNSPPCNSPVLAGNVRVLRDGSDVSACEYGSRLIGLDYVFGDPGTLSTARDSRLGRLVTRMGNESVFLPAMVAGVVPCDVKEMYNSSIFE
ncbi:MAG: hypothetical protein ACI8Y7_000973 [Candidatus Woesearchaeota archaeon]|jgi:hypothetical protein